LIDKITIAVDSMERMVAFYSTVLGIEFSERELFERKLYGGRFGDIELLFCPKDLAGVEANVNTIQVRFIVSDLNAAFAQGVNHGGVTISKPEMMNGQRHAALRDPDGNSLELKERVA
jgi:catechol 2,3-dioxygenase-like lactoylglutathione lyase family enzyme